MRLVWVLNQSGPQLNQVWVLPLLEVTSGRHTLQIPPAVGCCYLKFRVWPQMGALFVCFSSILAPPSALGDSASATKGISLHLSSFPIGSSAAAYCSVSRGEWNRVFLSFWAGLSLRQRWGFLSVPAFLPPTPKRTKHHPV